MKDKLNITIKVADLAHIGMQVTRKDEEAVRLAEYYVNRVWSKWMTSKDVLGMVAVHFAKLYVLEQRKNENTDEVLRKFEEELDRILLKVE